MTSPAAPGENRKSRASIKLMTLISGILSLGMVLFVFFSHQGLYQTYRLRQEKARLDAENHRLAEENARLARVIDRLQHDREMIQDLIHRELNFVRKNEIIIQLPPRKEDALSPAAVIPERSAPSPPGGTETRRRQGQNRQAPDQRKTRP